MDKTIVVDARKCTGCKTCEVVCSFAGSRHFSPLKSRIKNMGDMEEAFFYSFTCLQCGNAPCVEVCPSGALAREDGVVRVEAASCLGCKLCVLTCPFGAVGFDEERKVAIKCEQCEGDPQCVAACPTGALRFEPVHKLSAERQAFLFLKLKCAAAAIPDIRRPDCYDRETPSGG